MASYKRNNKDSCKQHAQELLDECKEMVDKLLEEVKGRADGAVHSVKDTFSAKTVNTIKGSIETEASMAAGFKDQLVGGVKETVGRLLRDGQLQREGRRQYVRGRSEVELQRSLAEEKKYQKTRAQIVTTLLHRESLLNQIVFAGGFERYRACMRHVELRQRDLFADLYPRGGEDVFELKRFDVQPLLRDIRERNTRKPMVYVEVRERGLLRSIPITKKDLASRRLNSITNNTTRSDLLAAVRRSGPQKLRPVPFGQINDRSEVRLDLLHGLRTADDSRPGVLRDIVGSHQRQQLIHAQQTDATSIFEPRNSFEGVHKRFEQAMKKMERPLDDKQGFLAEAGEGTAFTHI